MYNYYDEDNLIPKEPVVNHTTDHGPYPFTVDINKATEHNDNYRTVLWTGDHLQVALMSIPVGDSIGLEIHPDNDQFLHIEEGQGLVQMGDRKDNLYFNQPAYEDYALLIPAGTWHTVINTGNKPLKLFSIYAPPHHPKGTLHQSKAIAEASERYHPKTYFPNYR